jgi:hypothetical protein
MTSLLGDQAYILPTLEEAEPNNSAGWAVGGSCLPEPRKVYYSIE